MISHSHTTKLVTKTTQKMCIDTRSKPRQRILNAASAHVLGTTVQYTIDSMQQSEC